MTLKGPAAEAEGRGAGILEDPVVNHPAAAVRLAAHPADAPDDEGGPAIRQRSTLDEGVRDVPTQDEVGVRHLGAGEDALDLTGREGGRELRIGVPEGGERVAGHRVADIDVAGASAVKHPLAGELAEPREAVAAQRLLAGSDERQEMVGESGRRERCASVVPQRGVFQWLR